MVPVPVLLLSLDFRCCRTGSEHSVSRSVSMVTESKLCNGIPVSGNNNLLFKRRSQGRFAKNLERNLTAQLYLPGVLLVFWMDDVVDFSIVPQ